MPYSTYCPRITSLETDNVFFLIKNTDIYPVLTSLASLCEEKVLHDVTLFCSDGKMKSSGSLFPLEYSPRERLLESREEDVLVITLPDFSQFEIKQFLETMFSRNVISNKVIENKYYNRQLCLIANICLAILKKERCKRKE